jgi:hypothetical protein
MAPSLCLIYLISTVGGSHKNALGKGSTCNGHIIKLEQYTFLRYLCANVYSIFVFMGGGLDLDIF